MNNWEDVRSYACTAVFCILIGWLGGWLHAHNTVAAECQKLKSFYVGSSVYACHKESA